MRERPQTWQDCRPNTHNERETEPMVNNDGRPAARPGDPLLPLPPPLLLLLLLLLLRHTTTS